jgi:hypothetical protein
MSQFWIMQLILDFKHFYDQQFCMCVCVCVCVCVSKQWDILVTFSNQKKKKGS